ncbi:MAG TPA: hypothetical protein VNY52_05900 [Solirubrobacteraceae bacterium]|jgi:hypothetical protein|nr:hypothetical protein [Solirubrobacteraceae bacterium]
MNNLSANALPARATLFALALWGCGVLWASPAMAAAPVPTRAAIQPSFSPDRLGAKAAFTFKVHFTGGAFAVPSPVRRAIVHLPPGLSMHIPTIRSCTSARLRAHGAKACPARSLIGTGSALADIHAGAGIESEEAKVWAFLGPLQGGANPTIEILGEGYTPLEERVVITATVLPDKPPYGEELEMTIPPIPSIPLEPDASTVSFSLTVGGPRFRLHDPNTVVLPSHCPAGGFPFATEFTYADGSTSTTTATVPCP